MIGEFIRTLALASLSSFTSSQFYEEYRRMLRFERLPRALQIQERDRRVRAVLQSASRVELHREHMLGAGINPDGPIRASMLHAMPVLTKAAVQANFPDRVTCAGPDRSDWRYISTAGTADRLMLVHDFAKRDSGRAAQLRSLHLAAGFRAGHSLVEIPPDVCNIACGTEGDPEGGVLPYALEVFRTRKWRDRRAIANLRGLLERRWLYDKQIYPPFGDEGTHPGDEVLRSFRDRIRADRPKVLRALPAYLVQLACSVIQEGEEPLPAEVLLPMGGSISPRMRDRIEAGFTGVVRENFGTSEFGDLACDCELRDGAHVFEDLARIEILDAQGQPVAPGGLGRIVVTDLSNHAMPMIRYELGDLGRLVEEAHGCGRPTARLFVEGRVEDSLMTEDGRCVSSDAVMDVLYACRGVDQFQLAERSSGALDLQVVPMNGGVEVDVLELKLQQLLGEGRRVRVREAASILPEPNGKYRFVRRAVRR